METIRQDAERLQKRQNRLYDRYGKNIDAMITLLEKGQLQLDGVVVPLVDELAPPTASEPKEDTGAATPGGMGAGGDDSVMMIDDDGGDDEEEPKEKEKLPRAKSAKEESSPDVVTSWKYLESGLKTLQAGILNDQKDSFNALTKLTKSVNKVFGTEPETSFFRSSIELPRDKLNVAIAQHLYRQGLFELAEKFVLEANVKLGSSDLAPYIELYNILESIRNKNLQPAIEWAERHRAALEAKESILEFRLHRVEYVRILQQGNRNEAIMYARKHLSQFAGQCMPEIEKLMGCLLFESRLMKSPYAPIFSEHIWMDILVTFSKECCRVLGLAQDSALFVVVTVGSKALPTLLKASRIVSSSIEWKGTDQLPVEIDLDREFQYHSIFACPVSREESTADNPPMILPCGHCLCKNSIGRLPRGSSRFKCPYCPSEQTPAKCTQIHF